MSDAPLPLETSPAVSESVPSEIAPSAGSDGVAEAAGELMIFSQLVVKKEMIGTKIAVGVGECGLR